MSKRAPTPPKPIGSAASTGEGTAIAASPLLAVEDLHLWYDAGGGRVVRAVDGVSFTLRRRGEALGIVGESGSGKSSLALALMRLLSKNVARCDGSIRLAGRELTTLSPDQFRREIRWRRIAMVFQGAMSVLNPVLRIGEQIAEPLLLDRRYDRAAARLRVRDLLERVGLPGALASRYPHELSGGQRQRVGIATALALDPVLLILDEPTSALDVSVQAQIMNLLKDLKADPGISMLFITHDIGLASDLCDRIAVTYAGEQVELGPAERVLMAPRHPYSRLLLDALPRLHAAAPPRPLPGDPPDLTAVPPGCRFRPRCPYAFARCIEHPPPIPLEDGGHARCWLNDGGGGGGIGGNASLRARRTGRPDAADAHARADSVPTAPEIAITSPSSSLLPLSPLSAASPTSPPPPLVALDDVSMVFHTRKGLFRGDAVTAVSGVSLAITPGETLALVGESGSGKTTVGRLSLRLLQPTAGSIHFAGREITSAPEDRLSWLRTRTAIVFQDPFSSLNPYMTVADLIAEPLVIDGVKDGAERQARVRAAMREVDLTPTHRFANVYPTSLSGGQRQRVGIARALIRGPEYIVADEPVSMVDASSRVEILDLLRTLQRERGVAFLYITHDIASARHFADRIAVMYLGAIVESGTARQVIDNPVHPYTRALIAAVPEPDPANRFRRRATERWQDAPGAAIHPACPHGGSATAAALLEVPADAGHLVACHVEPPRAR